jgi:23S rRNA (cytidine1920-2'-O)/16S rRNA (cytidine1409-2'-O)-methyltransferase
MSSKKRLDLLINERYPAYTRNQIQSFIIQGRVFVDGHPCTKAGTLIPSEAALELRVPDQQYVSRAGFKLAHALTTFAIDVTGKVVLDAGISTGGFTDCLLQRGVKKVYGIDVGYGQVHEKIQRDPRVILHERTNLRHLTTIGEPLDLVTLDLSFISVLKVIDVVSQLLKPQGELIVLIKPQFEAKREQVGRGGLIKDPKVHDEVIERVTEGICAAGFVLRGVTPSPIEGSTGNKEFLGYFVRSI